MKKFKTLTIKMIYSLLFGFCIALICFFILFFTSNYLLKQYFSTSSYIYNSSENLINELQEFVNDNNIPATNTNMLRKWAKEKNIVYFTVSRERMLIYDNTYNGSIPLQNTSSEQLHYSWQYFHTVSFADGDADVFIYNNYDTKFYILSNIITVLISSIIWLGIFVLGVKKEAQYIVKLNEEVKQIENGCLENSFTFIGNDELTNLAYGLDKMRIALLEKEQYEKQLKTAQDKLVLGMAHDLRTPLTSLMAYLEIIKKQDIDNKTLSYTNKAFDKTIQIRNLSEQLFEFFFVNSHYLCQLEEPENIEYSIGDYLSELCALLENNGFNVESSKLKWNPVYIQINSDYIGRIINNILSNILKYADKDYNIELSSTYFNDNVSINIRNKILNINQNIQGTGIGLNNICMMMEQMNNKCETIIENDTYTIKLIFMIKK